jgi:hypothetical protein
MVGRRHPMKRIRGGIITSFILLAFSCSFDFEVVDGIEYHDRYITLVSEGPAGKEMGVVGGPLYAAADKYDKVIKYIARVLPVDVDGATVQANMVRIDGDLAFIAYNTAGDVFRGAIQIIDISTESRPKVRNTFIFPELDINSLCVDSGKLLFGAAASPDFDTTFHSRTFVGTITIDAPETESAIIAALKPLNQVPGVPLSGSYSVTAITRAGDYYYVASGALDGGIVRLGLTLDLASGTFEPYADVRDICGYSGGVFALKGTADDLAHPVNGAILYSKDDGTSWTPLDIPAFGSPYKKATLDLSTVPHALFGDEDASLFLGLSEAGMKVMSWKSGALTSRFSAANPLTGDPGLLADTNGINFDSLVIFSANGNYGFRVFQTDPGNTPFAAVMGYHDMRGSTYGGVHYSANDIAYRGGFLFVATGAGGVNVYTVKTK